MICWILVAGGIVITAWLKADSDPARTMDFNFSQRTTRLKPLLVILAPLLWLGGLIMSVKSLPILLVSVFLSILGFVVYIPWTVESRRLSDRFYQIPRMYALLAHLLVGRYTAGTVEPDVLEEMLLSQRKNLHLKKSEIYDFVEASKGSLTELTPICELAFKHGARVKTGSDNMFYFVEGKTRALYDRE